MTFRTTVFMSLTAFFMLTSSVFAAKSGSSDYAELYYQPDSGQHALTPGFGYASTKAEAKATLLGQEFKSSMTGTSTGVSLNYDYGLSENFSLGVAGGYSTSSSKTKTTWGGATISETESKNDGLTNVGLNLGTRFSVDAFAVYLGVNASLSPGDRTYDATANKGNNYSGGTALSPYLAFSTKLGSSFLLGVGGAYSSLGDRTTKNTNPTSETKTTGGNAIMGRLFAEFPMDGWTPGLSAGYTTSEKTKTTTSAGTSEYDGSSAAIFSGYLTIRAGAGLDLLADIGYGKPDQTSSGGITVENAYSVSGGLALRLLF